MAYQVRGVTARGEGAPVSVETIVVPDAGAGEARVRACGVCHSNHGGVPHSVVIF
jgi:S-(hydroxymethyl)mycothiol dehydrogenase